MQVIRCDSCNKPGLADQAGCSCCSRPSGSVAHRSRGYSLIEEVEEIRLDNLRAKDYLILQTENSTYRLTMLDPAERRGLLSGGKLDSRGIQVTLVATTAINSKGVSHEAMKIKVNSRALFALNASDGGEHFITSVIRKLTQVTGRLKGSLPAEP